MTVSLTLCRADEDDLEYVETLLSRNGLPSRDVGSGSGRFFLGLVDDDPIGVIGLEHYGSDGLLRSLVVERAARGNGYGKELCVQLEERALRDGIDRLFLLTTTAAPFFSDLGYVELDREKAPEPIQETSQFTELCPDTATCLVKGL